MPFYGLYIPVKGVEPSSTNNGANVINFNTSGDTAENKINKTDESKCVFRDKTKALKVLKEHKDARFKEFRTEEEAVKYAQSGFEIVQNKYNDVKTPTESLEKAQFRAPTRPQLMNFRHYIEEDAYKDVKKMIMDNPRYLVSSGDTPTILKESFRYNAMHVCAIHNSTRVAQIILDTVSDPKFAELLIGRKGDEKSCKNLNASLLDYYLNLAEKGRNETPLHLASKYGHTAIVKILLSYPECKQLRNAQNKLARYIICDRNNKNDSSRYDIQCLFDNNYYVPVIRSNDSAIPAQVGEPFVANNPPNLNCDPLTPELEIKALAGPMTEASAKRFFRRWKTPPRLRSSPNSSFISPMKPHNSTPIETPQGSNTSFNTPTARFKGRSLFNSTPKGDVTSNCVDKSITDDSNDIKENGILEIEANGNGNVYFCTEERNNNNELHTSLHKMRKADKYPRTPLFRLKNNAFSNYREYNIASPMVDSIAHAGEINDSLLNVSDIYDSQCFKERHIKNTDVEKGLERIGRILAKENDIEWREYWDFLDELIDIASEKGIEKLEKYLEKQHKEHNQCNNKTETTSKPNLLDDVCNAFENAFRISPTAKSNTTLNISTAAQSATPYTYVEKSLQVHAKRMTKTIIHNIDNEMPIIDALILELRRIKSLIYSFKEDASFTNVNFEKVHSRIGNLVSMFLENSQEVSKQMRQKILVSLQNISTDEDERREHIECVRSRIVEKLQHLNTDQTRPENVKTEELCSKIWSQEKDCDCQWENNSRRKTSRRNRMAAFNYKNKQRVKQQEKLQNNPDNQQKANNDEWHNANDSTNDSSNDEFWSDFGASDSDEDEVFVTPFESPSSLSLFDDTDDSMNRIFIFGNEPTKRDLDVLNAIFHVNIDKTKYPNIHSWKSTIMRYTNEEMDFFPSPRTVKKSYSFMSTSSNKKDLFVHPQMSTSLQKSYSIVRSNTSSSILNSPRLHLSLATGTALSLPSAIIKTPILEMPMAKRLFMSPGRTKSMPSIELEHNTDDASNADVTEDVINRAKIANYRYKIQLQSERPFTPPNKIPGLFSIYREPLNSAYLDSPTSLADLS